MNERNEVFICIVLSKYGMIVIYGSKFIIFCVFYNTLIQIRHFFASSVPVIQERPKAGLIFHLGCQPGLEGLLLLPRNIVLSRFLF